MIEEQELTELDESDESEDFGERSLPEHSVTSLEQKYSDVVKPVAFSRLETLDGIDFEVITTNIAGADTSEDIKFTTNALNKILEKRELENLDEDYFLRIFTTSTLNQGLKYFIKFTTIFDENDVFFRLKEIDLAIDRKSLFFVLGHEIDYISNGNEEGFAFKNIVKKMTRTFYSPE